MVQVLAPFLLREKHEEKNKQRIIERCENEKAESKFWETKERKFCRKCREMLEMLEIMEWSRVDESTRKLK